MTKTIRMMGVEMPRRRFTAWAGLYFLAFFCIPLLAICALLDTALYLVLRAAFGVCWGVPCWFE